MTFIRNAWYMAGWAEDVTDKCASRQLLGEPVLMYRLANGKAVALSDRCPHRFAPLSKGNRDGDIIECLYHGLRFDSTGTCVKNPHGDGKIPPNAVVRSYPLIERDTILWIWMGDAARADASRIPEFKFLRDPGYKALRGMNTVAAYYELVTDNLLDLSHINFLHAAYQKNDDLMTAANQITQERDTLVSKRFMPDIMGPMFYRQHLKDKSRHVDYWLHSRWDPPGSMSLDVGVTYAGQPENEGLRGLGTHVITPESERSTHYFYALARNHDLDNTEVDAKIREWQRVGFKEQDQPMLEDVQRNMGTTDLMALKPVILQPDNMAMRARRIISRLLQEDAKAPLTSAVA
ncbi:MAG: Rieske 2Fe-2S domain-containing protein [Burkholderiales bacterium]